MADVLTSKQRRLNMSRIRSRDTKPEMILRRGLHALGLRFRVCREDLPGSPDLVFSRHRAVVLVHGCFWHGHSCPMFKWPATRPDFWKNKIIGNCDRDQAAVNALREKGWRVLVVWECALRGPGRWTVKDVVDRCEDFVRGPAQTVAEISGDWRTGNSGQAGTLS